MAIFGLIFLTIALVLIGVGLAFGTMLCAAGGVLVLCGVVSSSALIGFWCRHPRPAIGAFCYQIFSGAGLACGMLTAWLTKVFFLDEQASVALLIAIGGLAGAIAGFTMAACMLYVFDQIAAVLIAKAKSIRPHAMRVS